MGKLRYHTCLRWRSGEKKTKEEVSLDQSGSARGFPPAGWISFFSLWLALRETFGCDLVLHKYKLMEYIQYTCIYVHIIMRCIDSCLPVPAAGACKAVEQEEEEEPAVSPGASGPVSPPLLPNAFHIPSSPQPPGTPVTPSAPSPVEGPGNSECVVCMETGVRILQRNNQQA